MIIESPVCGAFFMSKENTLEWIDLFLKSAILKKHSYIIHNHNKYLNFLIPTHRMGRAVLTNCKLLSASLYADFINYRSKQ